MSKYLYIFILTFTFNIPTKKLILLEKMEDKNMRILKGRLKSYSLLVHTNIYDRSRYLIHNTTAN